MKLILFIPVFLLFISARPFQQDGSVDTDTKILDERIEAAKQNRLQEKRAEEMLKQEQQTNEEIDHNLRPEVLLQDNEKKEGSVE